jgi:hypothetical protein
LGEVLSGRSTTAMRDDNSSKRPLTAIGKYEELGMKEKK